MPVRDWPMALVLGFISGFMVTVFFRIVDSGRKCGQDVSRETQSRLDYDRCVEEIKKKNEQRRSDNFDNFDSEI
jgi:hypothetical protein